ncbi:LLM class flavin-dependent oxidoreductase [Sandaracinus amylolyticus]|uniref:LLM class flavin-dependent oxidoreductase n=1 Tax=Sandaracinus amylolyticus TaxID=927083 RepID=UPI001F37FD35|nr:LLM class flavin-dependent oxidoreductase [Sandaracinus amylolyticus]UJR83978.1 Hypothetical protein I5071_60490 [Sandaracinus amylolyticus]
MPRRHGKLVLNAFFMRFGHHPAAWRHRSATGNGRPDVGYWTRLAQRAEDAKLDTFFLADFIGRSGDDLDTISRQGGSFQFEPVTLLSAIASLTRNIGLVATINTNFSEPYNVARLLSSLDHVSGGRAGWNVVSSLNPATAKNFGLDAPPSHSDRYERADEFLDVVKKLWDSWSDDAFDAPDRPANRFFDPKNAFPVKHRGEHFSVDGLLDVARPLQGHPVIVQAGNSDTGREFAAKVAEMTYSSAQSLDVAREYYSDVKSRAAKYGRDPEDVIITPGLSVLAARSDAEAQEAFAELQEGIDFRHSLNFFGVDLSGYPLDGPLPELPEVENGKGRARQLVELARRENLTIRQLVLRFAVSRGHLQAVGSPKTIADTIEAWWEQGGADGFNVVPPLLPRGFDDFATLVIPELRRRGLARREYGPGTYRDRLGLRRPVNRHLEEAGPLAAE